MESDGLIKSSVENLVPNPSESEDLSKDLSDIEKFNSKNSDAIIESFSPSPIPVEDSDSLMEEIDLFLTPDDSMPPGHRELMTMTLKGYPFRFKNFLAMNPLSHFTLNVPSPPLPYETNRMMMILSPIREFLQNWWKMDISDNSTRELFMCHVR
ncbi:hypothetical protein Tco_1216648 [Tanacetum coccineum]